MSARPHEIRAAIRAVSAAFEAPGDYGYDTPKGDALYRLYCLHTKLAPSDVAQPDTDASLEDRLGDCLAAVVDATLLSLGDPDSSGRNVDLRLSSFQPELAERACALLEEAGK